MSLLFTATGIIEEKNTMYGDEKVYEEKNFSHVVNANSAEEAEEKVYDYYQRKTKNDEYRSYTVLDLQIFDQID